MSSDYIRPEKVNSPKNHWSYIATLDEAKEDECALVIGKWDSDIVLAMRWNGTSSKPLGNPQSRGLPTWFIVPEKYYEDILGNKDLDSDKVRLARSLLSKS